MYIMRLEFDEHLALTALEEIILRRDCGNPRQILPDKFDDFFS